MWEREHLKVVDDQRGRPTSAEHLARVTIDLIDRGRRGHWHATDGGECTWYEFAQEIKRLTGAPATIEPCTSDQFPRPAKRPAYSVLDISQTEAELGPMSDNVLLDTGYDVIDFDNIYEIGYRQAFELDAGVLVTLDFSRSVDLRWPDGTITSGTSVGPLPLGGVPRVRVGTGAVDIRPTYTLAAELTNDTDLTFDVDFAAQAARGNFEFEFDSLIYDTSVNRSFGPLWSQDWQVANPTIDVYAQRFPLGGFAPVTGEAVTVRSSNNAFQLAR